MYKLIQKYGWLPLVLCALLAVLVGVSGLRANNLRMGELKAAVIAADEQNKDIQPALTQLATHVFNHINTTTEVTLASSYNRDAQAEIKKFQAAQPDGNKIYNQGIVECENPNVRLTVRAQCVAEYVAENSQNVSVEEISLPDERHYQLSFRAPAWSLDLAGVSLLIAGASAVAAVFLVTKSKLSD